MAILISIILLVGLVEFKTFYGGYPTSALLIFGWLLVIADITISILLGRKLG